MTAYTYNREAILETARACDATSGAVASLLRHMVDHIDQLQSTINRLDRKLPCGHRACDSDDTYGGCATCTLMKAQAELDEYVDAALKADAASATARANQFKGVIPYGGCGDFVPESGPGPKCHGCGDSPAFETPTKHHPVCPIEVYSHCCEHAGCYKRSDGVTSHWSRSDPALEWVDVCTLSYWCDQHMPEGAPCPR